MGGWVNSMKLKCTNFHCQYVWDYKGKHPKQAHCNQCGFKVNIKKARTKYLEEGEDHEESK